jgi:hypothetical protein
MESEPGREPSGVKVSGMEPVGFVQQPGAIKPSRRRDGEGDEGV